MAGDVSYPVLAGADVVAYFSLEEGSKPVIARGDIRATHRSYDFYFSSLENRETFKVRTEVSFSFLPCLLPYFYCTVR